MYKPFFFKLKIKESLKLEKRKPETLKNCLTKFKKSWSDLDIILSLTSEWIQIVGTDLAKECKPLKIENNILTIVVNNPQWRQALQYNKHKLKESIIRLGINLKNIRIIQNYPDKNFENNSLDNKEIWDNHPSRVRNQEIIICKNCNRPAPKGEIERWGNCTFCWRDKT